MSIAALPNAMCEIAKSLCIALIILLHLQMCCKRRLIKKRIKVPKRSGQAMQHDPSKKGNLPKSQAPISPTKNIVDHLVRTNLALDNTECVSQTILITHLLSETIVRANKLISEFKKMANLIFRPFSSIIELHI